VHGKDNWEADLDRVLAETVLRRLPEPQRVVLMLRYMDDRPLAECAELLGRTVPATEALLLEARRTFKALYPSGEVS
jgi:RNA polymerase sigma-70 factor (ECF subfamily)